MANISNCSAIILQIWKQQKAEAEALNFRVLIDCLNKKIEKVKGSNIVKCVQKNILVI